MEYEVKKEFTYSGKTRSKGSTIKSDEFPESIIETLLDREAIGEFEKLEIEEPEVEVKEDDWSRLERIVEEGTSELPPKWNPERDNPPEVGYSIFGEVKRTGEGPYGRFLVVERKDTGEKQTIWEQTALSELMDVAVKNDKVGVKFTGLEKNPRGQKYLNYTSGCFSKDGKVKLG